MRRMVLGNSSAKSIGMEGLGWLRIICGAHGRLVGTGDYILNQKGHIIDDFAASDEKCYWQLWHDDFTNMV